MIDETLFITTQEKEHVCKLLEDRRSHVQLLLFDVDVRSDDVTVNGIGSVTLLTHVLDVVILQKVINEEERSRRVDRRGLERGGEEDTR